ncbi:MAG TPA: chemotaxis protein CheB [Nitrospira sp.]|nr:chemotaxis protein CheB [Nitrospira sp.]
MTFNAVKRDVIVIGASIGGVQALLGLCEALPDDLPAVVGIVIHRSPWYRIDAAALYGHRSRIRVREGRAGDNLTPGTVYFAPSDHHMLFGASGIELSRGPRVHFVRPAADMLFVSAAATFRDRVAGILLTGGGSDGAHGLVTIKEKGGLSIVQRPSEAADPTMPLTGIREDSVDYVASLEELPSLLTALASGEPIIRTDAPPNGGTRKGQKDGGRRQGDRKVSQSQH